MAVNISGPSAVSGPCRPPNWKATRKDEGKWRISIMIGGNNLWKRPRLQNRFHWRNFLSLHPRLCETNRSPEHLQKQVSQKMPRGRMGGWVGEKERKEEMSRKEQVTSRQIADCRLVAGHKLQKNKLTFNFQTIPPPPIHMVHIRPALSPCLCFWHQAKKPFWFSRFAVTYLAKNKENNGQPHEANRTKRVC